MPTDSGVRIILPWAGFGGGGGIGALHEPCEPVGSSDENKHALGFYELPRQPFFVINDIQVPLTTEVSCLKMLLITDSKKHKVGHFKLAKLCDFNN